MRGNREYGREEGLRGERGMGREGPGTVVDVELRVGVKVVNRGRGEETKSEWDLIKAHFMTRSSRGDQGKSKRCSDHRDGFKMCCMYNKGTYIQ